MRLQRFDTPPSRFFILCVLASIKVSLAYRLPLTGTGWTLELQNADNNTTNWTVTDAKVPSDVYLDLYNAGKIGDPYYRDNDVNLRWIAYQNWIYSKLVSFPAKVLSKRVLLLRADGLDTFVDIYLNGHLIGQGSNMFREYLFRIPREYINENGTQFLSFKFHSPIAYGESKFEGHKVEKGYSVGLTCRSPLEHGECHANFVRKMQASYGWDWGPAFPTMGIWKFLSIEAIDTCYLKRFSVVPAKNEAGWVLNTEFFLYCHARVHADVEFCVTIDELEFRDCWSINDFQAEAGPRTVYRQLTLPKNAIIDVWWPNGLGRQRLYEVVGAFHAGDDSSYRVLKIGFRHVQLIEDPVLSGSKEKGLTFYVKINDLPVFLKGANWIPADSFQTRLNNDRDRLEFYFRSMREANMNCIRVWGGGVYESDLFYSLADRYGITIWHDMMFAVNLYPATPEFLTDVRSEIEDQVNRLKSHPSIIIWAGNNENEQGLAGHWYEPMDGPGEKYRQDYMALYNSTIYDVINRTDFFTRPYLLSSPSNGLQTIREGGIAGQPNSYLFGDAHFYSYGGDSWNWTKYPTLRCVTEYGFLSMPHLETLRQALNELDLEYFSAQMKNRQHHDDGRGTISEVLKQFDFFGCTEGKYAKTRSEDGHGEYCEFGGRKGLENIIYLSQIHQAVAYKTETEHYRRWRSTINEKGEGFTMCALYWQLNDIWQAPSWSSIDYELKWKASHYEAKRFFAHLLVSPYIAHGGNLKVFVVNDLNQTYQNLTLVIKAISMVRFRPLTERSIPVALIGATSAAVVYESPISKFENQTRMAVLSFMLVDSQSGEEMTPNNVMFMEKINKIPPRYFGRVRIDGVSMQGSKVVRIDLVATSVAPFVWLDVAGIRGFFTDNSFTMITKRRTVRFIAWESISLMEITKRLTVKTLADVYR